MRFSIVIPSVQTTELVIKPVVFWLSFLPLIAIIITAIPHANPIEHALDETGIWTLRFLCLTLMITPIRQLMQWHSLIKIRRQLGLFSFFYSVLHFLCYAIFDQSLDFAWIIEDMLERPFIFVGLFAFICMIPLAVTSSNKMIKKMGGKNWQLLHRLVYLIAVAGIVHFLWIAEGKVQFFEPLFYGFIIALLLGYRLYVFATQAKRAV